MLLNDRKEYQNKIKKQNKKQLIMKRLSTCILLLATAICASGQTLTGKVTDEQQQPLSYANVVFLSLPDSHS